MLRLSTIIPGKRAKGDQLLKSRVKELGIERIRCPLSATDLVITPQLITSQYSTYLSNFSSWVISGIKNEYTSLGAYGRPGKVDLRGFPFKLPGISVRTTTKAKEEQIAMLKTEQWVVCADYDGKNSYFSDNWTIPELVGLMGGADYYDNSVKTFRSRTNVGGADMLLKVKKLLELCIATHTYPLFESEAKYQKAVADHLCLMKESRVAEAEAEKVVDPTGGAASATSSGATSSLGKRTRVDSDDYVQRKQQKTHKGERARTSTSITGTDMSAVRFATPYPRDHDAFIEVTAWSLDCGVFLEYLPELIDVDSGSDITMFLTDYAYKLLGDTEIAASNTFSYLIGMMGAAKGTDLFRGLSHIAYCFMKGIKAGMCAKPLFRGDVYCGCFLWGAGVKIHYDGQLYDSETNPAKIRSAVLSCATVETNLDKIGKLLEMDVSKCTGVRALDWAVRSCGKVYSTAVLEQVRKLLVTSTLASVKYQPNAAETILRTYELVKNGIKYTELPMYPHAFMTEIPELYYLSSFGSRAPSPCTSQGRRMALRNPHILDSYVTTTGKQPVWISFEMKPLNIAAKELATMCETGEFVNGNPRRGTRLNATFIKFEERSACIARLRALLPDKTIVEVVPKAKVVVVSAADDY